jgi:integrase
MTQPEPKGARKRERVPDNLYQRNGVWWIRYSVGGQKIRRSLSTPNQREAKRPRDQILAKRSVAEKFGIEAPVPRQERTFGEVLDLWLQSRRADGSLRPGSLRVSEQYARNWFRPAFGTKLMSEISVEDIEGFIAHLRRTKGRKFDRPLSRSTIGSIVAFLNMFFRWAIKRHMHVGVNPFDQLDRRPTMGPGRDVALTADEAQRLLAELFGETHYKASLALATGFRWGEIHGLAWKDVQLDIEPPLVTIRRSWNAAPKTEASGTTVPLSDDAAAILRRWQSEQGQGAEYVFPDRSGALRRCPNACEAKRIKAAAKRAGIDKNVTPHVFRHTFGTWVYETTGDPKIVQRLMRHTSFQTSMRYVHDRRELGDMVNRLPKLSAARLQAV